LIVKDLMSTNVVSIDSEATVKDAASKMAQQEIGSLVVIEQNKLVGIVTERDLLSRSWPSAGTLRQRGSRWLCRNR